MIVGILGKGGSGKSTVATNIVKFLAKNKSNNVLAIDSDHNMDLTYNLDCLNKLNYLGNSLNDLKKISNLDTSDDYRRALSINKQGLFKISPKDEFTKKYTTDISSNLSLMSAGPQTSDILEDKSCSHILFTSLKVYLPLFLLNENEWVIVDEKAGADGVSTGIPTGFDVALVVTEPTIHGMKTAKQISELLDYYSVPYEFVVNKLSEKNIGIDFYKELGKEPIAKIPFDQSFSEFKGNSVSEIVNYLKENKLSFIGKRFERSKNKFKSQ